MLNDTNISTTFIKTITHLNETSIAFYSALAAIISAIVSIWTAYNSKLENKQKVKSDLIKEINKKFDELYLELNKFIRNFTNIDDNEEKRIARDQIDYMMETLRIDLENRKIVFTKYPFGNLTIKISDITFEKNFEKNMNDLNIIKQKISELKQELNDIT